MKALARTSKSLGERKSTNVEKQAAVGRRQRNYKPTTEANDGCALQALFSAAPPGKSK